MKTFLEESRKKFRFLDGIIIVSVLLIGFCLMLQKGPFQDGGTQNDYGFSALLPKGDYYIDVSYQNFSECGGCNQPCYPPRDSSFAGISHFRIAKTKQKS